MKSTVRAPLFQRSDYFRRRRWWQLLVALLAVDRIIEAAFRNRYEPGAYTVGGSTSDLGHAQTRSNPVDNGQKPDAVSNDNLRSIYETERRDEQNNAALIVAVTVGSLAYLAGAALILSDAQRVKNIPIPILLAAPFPLFILSGYLTFQYAASRLRQSYLIYLEGKFSDKTWSETVKVPGYMALHQGLFGSFSPRLAAFALLLMLTLFAHVLAVFGLTIYTIAVAAQRVGWSSVVLWFACSIHGLLALVNVYALVSLLWFTLEKKGNIFHELRAFACNVEEDEWNRWTKEWEIWNRAKLEREKKREAEN